MEALGAFLTQVDEVIWGLPLIIAILLVGIFLSVRLKFVQVRYFKKAARFVFKDEDDGAGAISSFASLCTALSATIGTGNIVGVATAISLGGPGAMLWMCLAAFVGMATKYAEGLLAVKYRSVAADGHILGGAFYYIEQGMGKKFRWLAQMFAFFGAAVGLLGIGTFAQVNGIAKAVQDFFDPGDILKVNILGKNASTVLLITSLVITAIVALVVIGGLRRISAVAEVVVPFMAVVYVVCCLVILAVNAKAIPGAISQIFSGAFTGTAAVGGFAGASVRTVMQKGVSRGIFSNEAGLGSSTIASASAKTKWPARQGLVSMMGTFIDTIVICSMTGLCIITSGSWAQPGLEGVLVTSHAFETGFFFAPVLGRFVLMLCLIFFAFTTILGWNFYGEQCVEYLCGGNLSAVRIYKWAYIFAVFIGPFMSVELVWTIADIFNGLMAIPNLIALVTLSSVVVSESKKFFKYLSQHGE